MRLQTTSPTRRRRAVLGTRPRRRPLLAFVVVVAALLTGCSSGGSDGSSSGTISSVALDLVTPLDGNAYSAASLALGRAAFAVERPGWEACLEARNVQPDPAIGFELSHWSVVQHGLLPSITLAEQEGGFNHHTSELVRNLARPQAQAYAACQLTGDATTGRSARSLALHRITRTLGSKVVLDHQHVVQQAVDDGDWTSAQRCLESKGASEQLASTPDASLGFVQQSVDETGPTAAARQQLDNWRTCTEDWFRQVHAALAKSRERLVDEAGETFRQLSRDLATLGVKAV